ncbi:MAG: exonuclease SbcCD subunit D [Spirochaetales bacterium]|nr:exonuclease SbcCD subunit D [Spirochaetales bacterium]
MKFLHTSDWHLGAKLGDYSRLPEQRLVLEEIRGIAEREDVDFILLAGDIFDNFNPSNEAVELLYQELKKMTAGGSRPVIAIAGNHDSPDRIEAPDPLAAECGIFFAGYPDFTRSRKLFVSGTAVDFPAKGIITVDFPEKPQVRILITPYANENRLRKFLAADKKEELLSALLAQRWSELAEKYCDDGGVNILAAHLFMTAGEKAPAEPDEERSILHPGGLELIDARLLPMQVQYTALGHLHRPSEVRSSPSMVVYSGSPLAFGLSEEDQQKSVSIVELEPGGKAAVRTAEVSSGRRIYRRIFGDVDSAVEWLGKNQECYIELIIECDNYISAEDRRRLHGCHDGITAVIPKSREEDSREDGGFEDRHAPDLSESLEGLFRSYFSYCKGVEPDDDLMEIFREIAAQPGGDE